MNNFLKGLIGIILGIIATAFLLVINVLLMHVAYKIIPFGFIPIGVGFSIIVWSVFKYWIPRRYTIANIMAILKNINFWVAISVTFFIVVILITIVFPGL